LEKTGKSIILIGMPGVGKSTVGVLLAKELGMDFLDTDVAIQVREGRTLQEILDETGYLQLREIEEDVLLQTDNIPRVIATGGSAIYSEAAMRLLGSVGKLVYMVAPIEVLEARINNFDTRGIARQPGQSFEDLFRERSRLYEQYANFTLDCGMRTPAGIVADLVSMMGASPDVS
jgi:shikimate kinase